jgi:hypothetical protein
MYGASVNDLGRGFEVGAVGRLRFVSLANASNLCLLEAERRRAEPGRAGHRPGS